MLKTWSTCFAEVALKTSVLVAASVNVASKLFIGTLGKDALLVEHRHDAGVLHFD